MNYIAKFNPYNMDDATVLAVATGRRKLLAEVLHTLAENLLGEGIGQHFLLWAPRGMGKSFFLKYLKVNFQREELFQNSQFILLPEEQTNIAYPSDLIKVILNYARNSSAEDLVPSWKESEESWGLAYQELQQYCKEKKAAHNDFLLVVVVENMDELLQKFSSKIAESRLRSLLEKLENFILIGASTKARLDGNYKKRLFHAFKKISLRPWQEEDYFNYFDRRYQLNAAQGGQQMTEQQQQMQKLKLKAISQYTGGSPRMAVVLTNLLLEEDVVSTANTLFGLIDDLTPYYQDLIKSIPNKSKILFDALIRSKENCSQSELAEKIGANQSEISRSFGWLQDYGYVVGRKRSDSSKFFYHVSDRIFVLYYFRREVYHNQDYTPIWLLADFLMNFYQVNELRDQAIYHLREKPSRNAYDLAKLSLIAGGMVEEELPKYERAEEWLQYLDQVDLEIELSKEAEEIIQQLKDWADTKEEEQVRPLLEGKLEEFSIWITQQSSKSLIDQALMVLVNISILYSNNSTYLLEYKIIESLLGLSEQNKNNARKADALSMIGKNLSASANYNKAIELHQQALDIHKELEDKNKIAWNLGEMGWNYNQLKRYEEAINQHQQVITIYRKLENKNIIAWNLGQLGLNLKLLKRHEEAINYYQQAIDLYREVEDKNNIAWNLGQIGWNLDELKKHEEAINYHQQAIDLYREVEDKNKIAWNLGQIGWNLYQLKRHEEVINQHQQALTIYRELENKNKIAWNLALMGWNFFLLEKYEEAINQYQQAITIARELENKINIVWNLGQIGVCYIMLEQYQKAWQLLVGYPHEQEAIFKLLWSAVAHLEKNKNKEAAFSLAQKLLQDLQSNATIFNMIKSLSYLFACLLEMEATSILIKDIIEEAKYLFLEKDHQTIILAAQHSMDYIESGKDARYLENIQPDLAIAVKAIVEEADL